MQIVVRDPWGHDHRLEHDGDRWWGCENLAHGGAAGAREALIENVVRAISAGSALPSGYAKVVRVSGQPFSALPGSAAGLPRLVIGTET
jgi:predicted patatin/cPLA2 family phospholipase